MSDDFKKIQMSDFEVSTLEELKEMGAYIPAVVPYYDKYTPDGKPHPEGDFDKLGENYIFSAAGLGGGSSGGDTPVLPSALICWDNSEGYFCDFSEAGHIFDVYLKDSSGTDIWVDNSTHRVKCKAGWYHVDATVYIYNDSSLPDYASLQLGVGINGVFSDYSDYDHLKLALSHKGAVIRHVSSIVHVTQDGSTLDFAVQSRYNGEGQPSLEIYLDQFGICKIAAVASGGGGGGEPTGDTNIVSFDVNIEEMLQNYPNQEDYIEASRQLWTDIINASFDNKVILASVPSAGTCIVELPRNTQGLPAERRESLLNHLKSNPAAGTISFFVRTESSYDGEPATSILMMDLNWVEGLQPRYIADIFDDFGAILLSSELPTPIMGQTQELEFSNVTPFKIEFDNPDFTAPVIVPDYSKSFYACMDLARRGYPISAKLDVLNVNEYSRLIGSCRVMSGDNYGSIMVTGLYQSEAVSDTVGAYKCNAYYREYNGSYYWVIVNDNLLLSQRGNQFRRITTFSYNDSMDIYYTDVFDGESVYVASLPNSDVLLFRVKLAPNKNYTVGIETVRILIPVSLQGSQSMTLIVTDSEYTPLLQQSGAVTTLENEKNYAVDIQLGYFNCVELIDRMMM